MIALFEIFSLKTSILQEDRGSLSVKQKGIRLKQLRIGEIKDQVATLLHLLTGFVLSYRTTSEEGTGLGRLEGAWRRRKRRVVLEWKSVGAEC